VKNDRLIPGYWTWRARFLTGFHPQRKSPHVVSNTPLWPFREASIRRSPVTVAAEALGAENVLAVAHAV